VCPDFPKIPTPAEVKESAKDALTEQGYTTARATYHDDYLRAIDPAEGVHVPTALGTEEDVYVSELGVPHYIEGYIDLQQMAAGDVVVIAQDMSLVTPVDYKRYHAEEYSGVQTYPQLFIRTKPARYGIRIRLNQTAGVIRSFPYQFFIRRVV